VIVGKQKSVVAQMRGMIGDERALLVSSDKKPFLDEVCQCFLDGNAAAREFALDGRSRGNTRAGRVVSLHYPLAQFLDDSLLLLAPTHWLPPEILSQDVDMLFKELVHCKCFLGAFFPASHGFPPDGAALRAWGPALLLENHLRS